MTLTDHKAMAAARDAYFKACADGRVSANECFETAISTYLEHSQKPPERTTRERIVGLIHANAGIQTAEQTANDILDVLSNPSPGVVEAMVNAPISGILTGRDMIEMRWQAGVQAIKRGEG